MVGEEVIRSVIERSINICNKVSYQINYQKVLAFNLGLKSEVCFGLIKVRRTLNAIKNPTLEDSWGLDAWKFLLNLWNFLHRELPNRQEQFSCFRNEIPESAQECNCQHSWHAQSHALKTSTRKSWMYSRPIKFLGNFNCSANTKNFLFGLVLGCDQEPKSDKVLDVVNQPKNLVGLLYSWFIILT